MTEGGTLVSDLEDRARNRLLKLAGHFAHPVRVDAVEEIGPSVYLLKVRDSSGRPDETQITGDELERALAEQGAVAALTDARDLFRWVEGQRIKLSFAHDPLFAVSLSGVRGLPHQIEAVYRHMLPQPRLRFVLADDPGAGKTIMAGLLLKELKLRGVVDRCLILVPAPLTPQWQDEMSEKFDEQFEIVSSDQVRHQLGRSAWDRYPMIISSIDFAKRDDVRDDLLRAEWDLVIIDEAHKCAAYTGSDDGAVKTKRYALAENLAGRTERLLLMTATPHSGDEDRFRWFLGLLDPDQFSSPDLVKRQIGQEGNTYFLRRQKEDLVNEQGHELFVPRHVKTQPFQLSAAEKELYDAVTRYVNEYLGAPATGGRGSAVALARTVLQRRLASSLGAIRSSLAKRAERLSDRADELERMTPAERRRRLAELGRMPKVSDDVDGDPEVGYDDVDEKTEDELATAVSGAQEIDALRMEVVELRQLVSHADRVRDMGTERKLVALHECLKKSELQELEDGRGKLLIFTEHKDTLAYLERHLREWGYTVCTIHGGHPPTERKQIQQEFRTKKQICIATEAAGEGINLQFCHLMVNYDLPWNPVRLEQRMGRVHRIGQQQDCYIFNFCATNTIEGQLLERLHAKLETMRGALQGRVYDVIGDLLTLNGIDFERLVKDTLLNPSRIEAAKQQINRMSAEKYQEYQQVTGIALAKRHVDMEWVRERDFASEERRLMPEYVEAYFLDAAEQVRLRVERRADTLLRIEHVPLALRSEDLSSVSRLGRPDPEYRKLTFRKEQRDRPEHGDAILCSPGHPLFAAVTESLDRELEARGAPQSTAVFVDPATIEPYFLHLFSYEVVGEDQRGNPELAFAEVVAAVEEHGQLHRAPADILHTFTPSSGREAIPPDPDVVKAAENWVRVNVQMPRTNTERAARLEQAELRRAYLEEAMAAQRRRLEDRWSQYDARVAKGDETYRLLRDTTLNRLRELEHRQKAKLDGFARLGVVRAGKVTHLGSVCVVPPGQTQVPDHELWRPSKEVEDAAMAVSMQFERDDGWTPKDVSAAQDGSGFDVRSVRRTATGDIEVRRIEVKGRSAAQGDVGLYRTEWYAAERWGDLFWLYVVYQATSGQPRLVRVQNPFGTLRNVTEISQITGYRVPGASIEERA
jgi:superfamily II DNA or RNA helicase